ncbi:MAG TPA: HEPN domain-containing protein [Acidimicrobiia bacterium]|nr:HEPN domain-containing protein [Acidimicrobiia bacterium]
MEWTGTFEVPGSGVRVGGRLTIDSGQSILTTFGNLAGVDGAPAPTDPLQDEDVEKIPMVWGVSEEGSRLTLLGLVSLGGNLSWPGEWTTRQQWICECAIGGHIEPVEPVTFSSIAFGLSDLSAWLGTPRPEEKRTIKPHRLDLTVVTHEIAEFQLGDVTIHFDGSFRTRSEFDSITVDYPARITASTSVELTWHELVNRVATPIEVLLWVATGRFSALDDLRVRLDGPHPVYERLWVSLLQPRRFEAPTRRLVGNELLFRADEIPDGLEAGLHRWFEIWSVLRPSFGPVIARYRAPFSYANDRFHSAVAALESYSAEKHGKRTLSKAERNRRIKLVRESLDSSAPDLTDWVLEAIEQAHYHTLRSRLERLLDEAGPIGEALVDNDREGFISAVVRARDAYAHSAPIVGGVEGGAALHWAAEGLNWLLRYYAMIEIGFEEEEVAERVVKDYTFVQVAERLRDALNH